MAPRIAALALLLLLPAAALAQGNANDPFPNPLQSGNVAATCDTWNQQKAAADPRAMQMLIGTWQAKSVEPGTPGLIPDTPIQIRVVNTPEGTFSTDIYGCYAPYGFQPVCATTSLYGEWVAHFAQDGSVAAAFLSAGTSRTGQALPVSCGLNHWRQIDPNRIVDSSGMVLQRVGN